MHYCFPFFVLINGLVLFLSDELCPLESIFVKSFFKANMNFNAEKAVVLMNLGSPDSPKTKDVRRYLNEFLMDKRVIDKFSYLGRYLLVKGIIVPFRAPKSAHAYQSIWTDEGSPLIVITEKLQQALQAQCDYPIEIAMRYAKPSPKVAFDHLVQKMPHLKEVLLIPMYPHYAMSSYETAVVYAQEIHKKYNYSFQLKIKEPYYKHPDYLNALAASIQPYLAQAYDHILFSFHGVPERHLQLSDPTHQHCLSCTTCCDTPHPAHEFCYRFQCLDSMHRVAQLLALAPEKYSFSFQSRLGKDPWLKPYTDATLKELAQNGVKKLLVVCPAFVSDCLETLEEIEIAGAQSFKEAGGTHFQMIPCLNVHQEWVATLANWINQF